MNVPLQRSTNADADRLHQAWTTWPLDQHTPVRLFQSLRAAGRRPCLLESVEGPERLARYSFLAVDPVAILRCDGAACTEERDGQRRLLPGPSHLALRALARAGGDAGRTSSELPPFRGGWVGRFAYEWASTLEPRVPRARSDPWNEPEALFQEYRVVLAFDHAAQKLWLMHTCPRGGQDYGAAMAALEALAAECAHEAPAATPFCLLEPQARPCLPAGGFQAGVERLADAIRAGDIFQAVLSQRFEQRFAGDPFTLYRVLRITNPAPHMFYFDAGGSVLVGSSPERLVAVRGGRVQNRPIAGTRPRHEDPDEDERLAAALRSDRKERAEHDMLVDLARNDLGRVARIGTVAVKEHAMVEKFARVQHLVSRVECELAAGRDALDALAASFPAGTVSGAPKVRAMELLADIEPETRGPYAGAFGYLDGAGNLDMAIVLRTIVVRGQLASVQAGAGIVHDSTPEGEYQETLHKARALFEAVTLAATAAFQPAAPAANAAVGARP